MRRCCGFAALTFAVTGCATAASVRSVPVSTSCRPVASCPRITLTRLDSLGIPYYPPVLRSAGIGGRVEIEFPLRRDGVIDTTAVVVERASWSDLAWSTLRALAHWHVEIDRSNGPMVADTIRLTFVFVVRPDQCREGEAKWILHSKRTAIPAELTVTACTPKLVPRD